jgi:hypothetical protein
MTRCDRCGKPHPSVAVDHGGAPALCTWCYLKRPSPGVSIGGTISSNNTLSTPSRERPSTAGTGRREDPSNLALLSQVNKDEDQDEDEERRSEESGEETLVVSASVEPDAEKPADNENANEDRELGWTDKLIEAHTLELLAPLPVQMPKLPPDAPPLARQVAEDFAYVFGLRLAACEDKPVPYACRWVAARLRVHYSAVNKACGYLERHGVLERHDDSTFHARDGKRRANLYLPRGFKPLAIPVEAAHRQPQHEAVDESAVPAAEVPVNGVFGGDTASVGGAGIHALNATDDSGAQCAIFGWDSE